ncbi:hypothetical protein [Methylocapsa palsarum]|uniref:Uncharacterized protein n=1 Tax=Methylocapsa palsarum TaxID=1612308 RepID=A0A1I4CQQ2_9HYPH|nr:hypothetical protein [Methylocapsa palsarum]SFK83588.1 hypothetical protein SAMN05444581_12727 [Methylocapsa palsarum]
MTNGFTLNKLAEAMRGMPRAARILIALPDGRLVEIDHIKGTHLRMRDDEIVSSESSTGGAEYGIVLVTRPEKEEG